MTRAKLALALIGALTCGGAYAATTAADDTYALIFRQGTLDAVERSEDLVYHREVSTRANPDMATRESGEIALSFPQDEPGQARLTFRQDDRHRAIGSFPAEVGNPIVMYHVETVVRDIATLTGGSPFYIRNRMKAALVAPAEIEARQIALDGGPASAQVVTLRPFEGDPNADRMEGLDALTVSFTLSDAVPGWYYELAASAVGSDGQPLYSSIVTIEDGAD